MRKFEPQPFEAIALACNPIIVFLSTATDEEWGKDEPDLYESLCRRYPERDIDKMEFQGTLGFWLEDFAWDC